MLACGGGAEELQMEAYEKGTIETMGKGMEGRRGGGGGGGKGNGTEQEGNGMEGERVKGIEREGRLDLCGRSGDAVVHQDLHAGGREALRRRPGLHLPAATAKRMQEYVSEAFKGYLAPLRFLMAGRARGCGREKNCVVLGEKRGGMRDGSPDVVVAAHELAVSLPDVVDADEECLCATSCCESPGQTRKQVRGRQQQSMTLGPARGQLDGSRSQRRALTLVQQEGVTCTAPHRRWREHSGASNGIGCGARGGDSPAAGLTTTGPLRSIACEQLSWGT